MEHEYWDIYDEGGASLQKCVAKGTPLQDGEYHLAAELWLVNSKSQILVQQRSMNCEILPGIWGLTTGRMVSGEDTRSGCVREAYEELGIRLDGDKLRLVDRIVRSDGTHLIWDVYCARLPDDLTPDMFHLQREEVNQIKWVTQEEFHKMVRDKQLFKYPEIDEIMERVYQILKLETPGFDIV